jgi:hypothetical protein
MCLLLAPTFLVSLRRAACWDREQTSQIFLVVRLPMSIASYAEQIPAIFPCRRQLSMSWRLISKLAKALGLVVQRELLYRTDEVIE